MDAKKFLNEFNRMCETLERCDKCELYVNENPFWGCMFEQIGVRPEVNEKVIAAIEKWSAEHPTKTRLMDFLEKYPDAPLTKNGLPFPFPLVFGYCNAIIDPKEANCHHCKNRLEGLNFCWNLPLEE